MDRHDHNNSFFSAMILHLIFMRISGCMVKIWRRYWCVMIISLTCTLHACKTCISYSIYSVQVYMCIYIVGKLSKLTLVESIFYIKDLYHFLGEVGHVNFIFMEKLDKKKPSKRIQYFSLFLHFLCNTRFCFWLL